MCLRGSGWGCEAGEKGSQGGDKCEEKKARGDDALPTQAKHRSSTHSVMEAVQSMARWPLEEDLSQS